jgi:hypothetical protein
MADLGHPDATQLVLQEILENHGYRGIDSVLVGNRVEDGLPHVPSTEEACDQCKEMVWMSIVSKAMVIKQAEKDGGKYYFLCMNCIPESLAKEPVIVPPEQKAEMLAAGFDIDKIAAEQGKTLQEVSEDMVKQAKNTIRIKELIRNILQRAAKKKGGRWTGN